MTSSRRGTTYWRSLVVAGVFLCMQVAAVSHAAAFGDATHSHDDTPCLIQIISDHAPQPAATVRVNIVRTTLSRAPVLAEDLVTHSVPNRSHSIRAPPRLSR